MFAPAEHPALDLDEALYLQLQPRLAVGQRRNHLRWVPYPFLDQFARPCIEPNRDVVIATVLKDSEAALEVLVDVEGLRDDERLVGCLDRLDPGQQEVADAGFLDIEGDQVPAVVDAGQVVGMDPAHLDHLLAEVAVADLRHLMVMDGRVQAAEELRVGGIRRERMEGHGLVEPVGDQAQLLP